MARMRSVIAGLLGGSACAGPASGSAAESRLAVGPGGAATPLLDPVRGAAQLAAEPRDRLAGVPAHEGSEIGVVGA